MSNQLQIKIMDVEPGSAIGQNNKPYEFLEVSFKNQTFQDKPEVKKVMPFNYKEVFNTLKNATKGDIFIIERDKNKSGFWDWISIHTGEATDMPTAATPQKTSPAVATKGSWETPEERATKQLYIIRQSCLAQAVNTLTVPAKPGTEITSNAVMDLAQEYVDFVCGTGSTQTDDIGEDIPY